jgi:hypothetical protein
MNNEQKNTSDPETPGAVGGGGAAEVSDQETSGEQDTKAYSSDPETPGIAAGSDPETPGS